MVVFVITHSFLCHFLLLIVLRHFKETLTYKNISNNAQDKSDSTKVKLDAIFKDYNHLKGLGCAVSVIKNGKVIATGVYGMANLEYVIKYFIFSSGLYNL